MSGDTFKRIIPLIAVGTLGAVSGGAGFAAAPALAGSAAAASTLTPANLALGALQGLQTANQLIGGAREARTQQAALNLQRAEGRLQESERALENETLLQKALAQRANQSGRTGANPNSGSAGHINRSAIAAADLAGRRLRTNATSQDLALQLESRRVRDRWRTNALSSVLGLGMKTIDRFRTQ